MTESPCSYSCCPLCGEGILRMDLESNTVSCQNCGARDVHVLGGQGKDAEEVVEEANSLLGLVIILFGLAGLFLAASAVLRMAGVQ